MKKRIPKVWTKGNQVQKALLPKSFMSKGQKSTKPKQEYLPAGKTSRMSQESGAKCDWMRGSNRWNGSRNRKKTCTAIRTGFWRRMYRVFLTAMRRKPKTIMVRLYKRLYQYVGASDQPAFRPKKKQKNTQVMQTATAMK